MNEKVTQIVALLFKDVAPSEEVQALHDEVLNNCQERFADLIHSGLSEEESLAAVAESLKGMDEVLKDYPRLGADSARPEANQEADSDQAFEKEKTGPSLMNFTPEDIRIIDAQLTNCDLEILLSEEGCSLQKVGDVHMQLESDGTLRLWQDSVPQNLFRGISWEDGLNHFDRLGDALNQLGQNISSLFSRGLKMATEECRVTVRLPANVHPEARIRTTSGDITWHDVVPGHDLILRTTSGDVDVQADRSFLLPRVEVSTMSGDAELSLSAEDVKISSVSGDITWNGDARSLKMNTTSGDAEAAGCIRETGMNTTSGDLSLELKDELPAEIAVNSVSGSIDLRLPGSVREITASLKSVSGNIRRHGVELTDSAPIRVRANTVSGNLKIFN